MKRGNVWLISKLDTRKVSKKKNERKRKSWRDAAENLIPIGDLRFQENGTGVRGVLFLN